MLQTDVSATSYGKSYSILKRSQSSRLKEHPSSLGSPKAEVKKFVIRILLPLFFILILLLLAFNFFFERKIILGSQISGAYKVNRLLSETHPDEIPIFGSGRAQSHYLPDSLGGNFFNYGMDGAYFNVSLMLMEQECKKKKKSPYLIFNFDFEGLLSSLGDISYYLYNISDEPVKKLIGNKYKFYYSLPPLKYFSNYELYFKYYVNDKTQLTKFINKGASIDKNTITVQKFNELLGLRRASGSAFNIDTTLKASFFSLIKQYPSRDFILVIPPYHHSYLEKFYNLSEVQSFLREICQMNNVKVLDFSHYHLSDDFYTDPGHLNLKGTAYFNKMLKDSLATIFHHSGLASIKK